MIVSSVGYLLTVILLVAGVLAFWGASFANDSVKEQLVAQKVSFPAAAELPDELKSYADQPVVTGSDAEAYSRYIQGHLNNMSGGKTYSEVSAEWLAGGMQDANLAQLRQTLFMGETLRGLLLNAYAFGTIASIAMIAAYALFGAAAVMLVLSILGTMHARRTPETAAI
jgi:hypothetical protein